jgi:hypothetical protein
MPQKSSNCYPYVIPSVDLSRIKSKVRPLEGHEFILVETLLRSQKIIKLYKRDKQAFHAYWAMHHGILSQDPLRGSHHSLLIPNRRLDNKLREFGYLDTGLGILDLGTIARIPVGKIERMGSVRLIGPIDGGARECQLRLQCNSSRLLHIQLDLSYPTEVIIDALRSELHKRGRNKFKSVKRSHFPVESVSRSWIETRLKYLRCYDLQQNGRSVAQIANEVYGDRDNAEGNTAQALRRARKMIRSAARNRTIPFELN